MKVYVTNVYSDETKLFEGSEDSIQHQIMFDYPWLRLQGIQSTFEEMIEHLDSTQAYMVETEDNSALNKSEPDNLGESSQILQYMLGFKPQFSPAFKAAQFLAGGTEVSFEKVRRAFWEREDDIVAAALTAYGFDVTEANRASLEAVRPMIPMEKSAPDQVEAPSSVTSATPEGKDVAEAVTRAFKDNFVLPVKLGGKHSNGSMVALDDETGVKILLKPNSGGLSPAAGAAQDPSSPSARESAFYYVAKLWGLFHSVPRAELLMIDGKPVAALHVVPWDHAPLERLRTTDTALPRRILGKFLQEGVLHQWAFLDAVCGNPDRHGGNILVKPDGDGANVNQVQLIDHGSAFAGAEFDPANDGNSFVPYYLRTWAPRDFSALEPEARLSYLPRVDKKTAERLGDWIAGLSSVELESTLARFGVDPKACVTRLRQLQEAVRSEPADKAINAFWVTV